MIETASDASSRLDRLIAMTRAARRQTFDGRASATRRLRAPSTARCEQARPRAWETLDDVLGGFGLWGSYRSLPRARNGQSRLSRRRLCFVPPRLRRGCLFFSLEMTPTPVSSGLLTDRVHGGQSIFYGMFSGAGISMMMIAIRFAASRRQSSIGLPVTIEGGRGLTITDVSVRARQTSWYRHDGGSLDVVFVDHMLLPGTAALYAKPGARDGRNLGRSRIPRKRLNVAVVALCQAQPASGGRGEQAPLDYLIWNAIAGASRTRVDRHVPGLPSLYYLDARGGRRRRNPAHGEA